MAEKKESYSAAPEVSIPNVVNQQVVETLLRLLNEVQQRASSQAADELPEEVRRDIAFAAATFALIDGGLKLQRPFTLAQLSPAIGGTGGGTLVTIKGTNFVPLPPPSLPAIVVFGGTAASTVTVISSTEISATSPPHAAGFVNVDVTTVGGTEHLPGAFRYQ